MPYKGARDRRRGQGHQPNQLSFDWVAANELADPLMVVPNAPQPAPTEANSPAPLVQRLPWDFQNSFPQPTPEAVEARIISDEDLSAENIRAIHDEHARELLIVLHDLDAVRDARRRGVDPATGKAPRTSAARERLHGLFEKEPQRLEQCWQSLMDSYESGFGSRAANAFAKAIRARHAGIEVVAESAPVIAEGKVSDEKLASARDESMKHRSRVRSKRRESPADQKTFHGVVARLPVPRPLPEAVAAGRFGLDDDQRPIRPGPDEVRAITEEHVEKLIDILRAIPEGTPPDDSAHPLNQELHSAIAAYGEDFGPQAARRLEAYARRHASLDDVERSPSRSR
jgi:hypothetical protein